MFEQTFKNIDDVLWKEAGCSSELDYTEQTSWLLFLKYLDDLEAERAMEAELVGKNYDFIIEDGYRWSDWAAPKKSDGSFDHDAAMTGDDLIDSLTMNCSPISKVLNNVPHRPIPPACFLLLAIVFFAIKPCLARMFSSRSN